MTLRILAAAGLIALSLAACGKQGPLQRPAQPMFGAKRAADAALPSADRNQPAAPGSTQELVDPASSHRSTSQEQVPGVNDPLGARPSVNAPGERPQ